MGENSFNFPLILTIIRVVFESTKEVKCKEDEDGELCFENTPKTKTEVQEYNNREKQQ